MINKSKKTKSLVIDITTGNPNKKAGSNRLMIQVPSSDWRLPTSEIRMTIRDAQSLRGFLNEYLDR